MGHRRRRLCPRRRVFRWKLRGGRRRLAGHSRRPSYSRLPAAAGYDLAGTFIPTRSSGQKCSVPLRGWATLRLFQAGLIAASLQLVIVVAITPIVILFEQYRDNNFGAHNPDPSFSVVSLLQLTYLACAAGVAMTKHRYVILTRTRIRHASRLMSASEPDRTADTIAIFLAIMSIECAVYVLPPLFVFLVSFVWF